MKQARLVLADDHRIFLDGLQRILQDKFDVVATVRNGRELLATVKKHRPDVAVVDISMPQLNGIEALRALKRLDVPTKTVLLTMHREVAFAAEAFQAGAAAYVLKDAEADELIRAIEEVLAGRFYLTPMITKETLKNFMDHESVDHSPRLTPRQREVLQLVTQGRKLKEIAHEMNISISTVEFHKTELMRRLGASNVADLIRYSMTRDAVPK
jgi:DNA-binding NarL/FixJ family response regulator